MGVCAKCNCILTFLIIFFVSFWFLLVVIIPQKYPIDMPSMNKRSLDNKKVELISQYTGKYKELQLIEVINNSTPNVFGEEAVLILTNEWQHIDYLNLLEKLLNELQNLYSLPIYLLKQKNNHNLYNHRVIKYYSRNVLSYVHFCIETHNIKKLTVIAYEEGALVTLLAFSEADPSFIGKIDKLILINTFNIQHNLYQNDPKTLSNTIKRNILNQSTRAQAISRLRIILINTFRTVYPQQPSVREFFHFTFQDINQVPYQMNQTLCISSKSMWDVNSLIDRGLYFNSQPFTELIIKLIIQDRKSKLTLKHIEYLLRYGQVSERSRSKLKKENLPSNCKIIHLQQAFLEENQIELKSYCNKIILRQRFKYEEAVLIFYSLDKIQIYDVALVRIPSRSHPENKVYTSTITNLKQLNQLIVIVRSKTVFFTMTIIRSPFNNPFIPLPSTELVRQHRFNIGLSAERHPSIVESCEGWRPILGLNQNQKLRQLVQSREENCYIQLQELDAYSDWFLFHWDIIRNIVIFTLFCTHILDKYVINRFYMQLFCNIFLLMVILKKVFLFQSIILACLASLIQIVAIVLNKFSQKVNIADSYSYWLVFFLPFLSELVGKITFGDVEINKSSSKLLWIQVLMVNSKPGFLITIIKCYFMLDIYDTAQSAVMPLILLSLWQVIHMPNFPIKFTSSLAIAKRTVVDILFLMIFCMSLRQQGSVIHQLINFYIITNLLLSIGEIANHVIHDQQ